MLNIYKEITEILPNMVPLVEGQEAALEQALLAIRKAALETTDQIYKTKPRNLKNLILHNFLVAIIPYLELSAKNIKGPTTQVLAFCARSLYELHLQFRRVQQNQECLEEWVYESLVNHIEILKALKKADIEDSLNQHKILDDKISEIENERSKTSVKKIKGTVALSQELKTNVEHEVLFKLFSKYLHPTSFLVNGEFDKIHAIDIKNTFLWHVQIYALNLIFSIRKEMNISA